MNSSSNSGGLGVPGTKPGVIASGPSGDDDKPKPIVSGPDVSAQPNASMQPSSSVQPGGSVQPGTSMQSTASAQFAQQTTPTQSVQPNTPAQPNMRPTTPMQPGVSMQSNTPTRPSVFTRPGMPIRTTSDDPIILDNSDGKRKSKRNWIIGGILILVATVTVVLAIVMATRGGGGNANGNYTGINGDFYRYANYLLNGDDKEISSLGGEYDESREYAVVKAFEDKNVDFFNKAKELWGRFYDRIMNDEAVSVTSKLHGDVESENKLLDFFSRYVAVEDYWADGDIMQLYRENGYNGAVKKIEDNYKDLEKTIYGLGADYINASKNMVLATLDMYSRYEEIGCMVDMVISRACIVNNSPALADVSEEYEENIININQNTLNLNNELDRTIGFCYKIEKDFSLNNDLRVNELEDENSNEEK